MIKISFATSSRNFICVLRIILIYGTFRYLLWIYTIDITHISSKYFFRYIAFFNLVHRNTFSFDIKYTSQYVLANISSTLLLSVFHLLAHKKYIHRSKKCFRISTNFWLLHQKSERKKKLPSDEARHKHILESKSGGAQSQETTQHFEKVSRI